jgi:hypothetical protein
VALEYFSPDYRTSAERFRNSAARWGAEAATYEHPAKRGRKDEALAIDVAWFGPRDADRVFLYTLGMHGLEGFAGSAVLLQWLDSLGGRLPPGQAVLAVHAVNPWGFSHLSRTTENNVDLNRNFLDFGKAELRGNPIYAELHPLLCPDDWTPETIAAGRAAMAAANERYGVPAVTDALARGQYDHADGLFYGGRAPEWSHRTLAEALRRFLPPGRKVTAIDLHTGLGPYAQPYFLCFHPADSRAYARVAEVFGEGVREANRSYQGGVRPNFSGLLIDALGTLVEHRSFTGLVIEFGTRPHNQVKDSLRLDRWLKFGRPDPNANRAALYAQVLGDYCPASPEWRRGVLSHSNELLTRGLAL